MPHFKSILFFLLLLFAQSFVSAQEKTFNKLQALEDIEFLQDNLLKLHPNLFVYNDKNTFDYFFERIKKDMDGEMSETEFYNELCLLSEVIKDGHTIMMPGALSISERFANQGFFPFGIVWDGEKLMVSENCSSQLDIPEGIKINSINGLSTEEIIVFMKARLMRDGKNETYQDWVINRFFEIYYSFFFYCPEYFNLEFELSDGTLLKKKVKAVPLNDIRHCQNKKLNAAGKDTILTNKGITLELLKEHKTAVLSIRDFTASRLADNYQQKFKPAIKAHFKSIKEEGIKHLIIDLRGNQGGRISYGKYLLAHLMQEPFKIVNGYKKVNQKNAKAETNRLMNTNGPSMGLLKPLSKAYRGKIYLLVDGGSFSNSGIVSAVLKRTKRATIFGEETGGSKNILAGYIKLIALPHSKIEVQIPSLQFILESGSPSEYSGVRPDLTLKRSAEELLKGEDPVMAKALQLIKAFVFQENCG